MIKDVITYLNSKLETLGYFNNVICLAERIEREGRIFPAQYASNGQYVEVNLDPTGSTCYWRKNGDVSVSEEENNSGIGVQYRTNIPLRFVGFMPKTYADNQYFADTICAEIIGVLTTSNSALKSALKAKVTRITATKYSTDGRLVGLEEYENINFEPNYSNAYFSIDFNLTFVTNNQCYSDICNDLPINGYVIIYDGDGAEIARVNCGGSYVCEGGSLGGTINVYLDGVLNQTIVSSDLDAEIVNISL